MSYSTRLASRIGNKEITAVTRDGVEVGKKGERQEDAILNLNLGLEWKFDSRAGAAKF